METYQTLLLLLLGLPLPTKGSPGLLQTSKTGLQDLLLQHREADQLELLLELPNGLPHLCKDLGLLMLGRAAC